MGRVAKKLGYGKNTTPVSNVEFPCRKLDLFPSQMARIINPQFLCTVKPSTLDNMSGNYSICQVILELCLYLCHNSRLKQNRLKPIYKEFGLHA